MNNILGIRKLELSGFTTDTSLVRFAQQNNIWTNSNFCLSVENGFTNLNGITINGSSSNIFSMNTIDCNMTFSLYGTGNYIFNNNNVNLLNITNNGNIGIGITSPAYKLDVTGGSINATTIFKNNKELDTIYLNISNNQWVRNGNNIYTDTSLSISNVGIGNTNPYGNLHIGSPFNVSDGSIIISKRDSNTSNRNFKIGYDSNYNFCFGDFGSNDSRTWNRQFLINSNATSNTFVINSNSFVGIGIANPAFKLDVSGSVNANSFIGNGSNITNINYNNITSNAPNLSNLNNWVINGNTIYNTTQNIAIGTTNAASYNLNVNGSINSSNLFINGINTNNIYLSEINANSNYLKISDASNFYNSWTKQIDGTLFLNYDLNAVIIGGNLKKQGIDAKCYLYGNLYADNYIGNGANIINIDYNNIINKPLVYSISDINNLFYTKTYLSNTYYQYVITQASNNFITFAQYANIQNSIQTILTQGIDPTVLQEAISDLVSTCNISISYDYITSNPLILTRSTNSTPNIINYTGNFVATNSYANAFYENNNNISNIYVSYDNFNTVATLYDKIIDRKRALMTNCNIYPPQNQPLTSYSNYITKSPYGNGLYILNSTAYSNLSSDKSMHKIFIANKNYLYYWDTSGGNSYNNYSGNSQTGYTYRNTFSSGISDSGRIIANTIINSSTTTTISGEWVQIKYVNSFIINSYTIKSYYTIDPTLNYNNIYNKLPRAFYLLATNTESLNNWDIISYISNLNDTPSISNPYYKNELGTVNYTFNGNNYISSNLTITIQLPTVVTSYKYYRFVFTQCIGATEINISEINLYGVENKIEWANSSSNIYYTKGNVGINVIDDTSIYSLNVNGSIYSSSNIIINSNIGIGNTNPSAYLHIGDPTISGSDGTIIASKNNANFKFGYDDNYNYTFGDLNSGVWKKQFYINSNASSSSLVIDRNGNVGINTNNTNGFKLNVLGTSYFSGNMGINTTNSEGKQLFVNGITKINGQTDIQGNLFQTSGNVVIATDSGYIGIGGTFDTSYKLKITGNTNISGDVIQNSGNTSLGNGSSAYVAIGGNTDSSYKFKVYGNTLITGIANFTNNINFSGGNLIQTGASYNILYEGKVGVGATSGNTLNSNFNVLGTSYFSGNMGINTTNSEGKQLFVNGITKINGQTDIQGNLFQTSGNVVIATDSGYIGIGGTFDTSYKLKITGNTNISGDVIQNSGNTSLGNGSSAYVAIGGNTDSSYKFKVYGNTLITGIANFTNNINFSGGNLIQTGASYNILYEGKVGVGATSGNTLNSNFNVLGTSYFSGNMGINTTNSEGKQLFVNGITKINGQTDIQGNLFQTSGNVVIATDSGYIGIGGTFDTSYKLKITGNTNISGDVIQNSGNTSLGNGSSAYVAIGGNTDSSYKFKVYGNTLITGIANFTNNINFSGGNLIQTGASYNILYEGKVGVGATSGNILNSKFNVLGTSYFSGNMGINTANSEGKQLFVNGMTKINGQTDIEGNVSIAGSLSQTMTTCNIYIAGNVGIGTNTGTLNSNLTVNGNASITGNLNALSFTEDGTLISTKYQSKLDLIETYHTPVIIRQYPPTTLSDNSTNVTGQSYGNGTYVCSSTPVGNGSQGDNSYFKIINNIPGNQFFQPIGFTNGPYTGLYSTSINSTNIFGAWGQIKMPLSIILTSYSLSPHTVVSFYDNYEVFAPYTWYLVASNDGTSWVQLDYRQQIIFNHATQQTFNIINKNLYSYYRIVITAGKPGASFTALMVGSMIFNGYEYNGKYYTTSNGFGIGGAIPTAQQKLAVSGISYFSSNIGINNSSPAFALDVTNISGSSTNNATYRYFNLGSSALLNGNLNLTNIAAKFTGSIWSTDTFATSSDYRIKSNIIDVDNYKSLEKILLIKAKTYNYKDIIDKGSNINYGFVAQEIKDIIPEAVSLNKSIIPNIYSICNCSNNTITISSNIESLKYNDIIEIIEIIKENEIKKRYNIKNISLENNQITINENLEGSNCFVYGTEVDDFHILNYNNIYTLNVSATQELYKLIQEQNIIIQKIIKRIELLESKIL